MSVEGDGVFSPHSSFQSVEVLVVGWRVGVFASFFFHEVCFSVKSPPGPLRL
jgi:hypothetical protein